jgi:transcriptional regulator with XRE-family HTH domain
MDQKKIGSFLKELRKEKNVTQQQFAEIIGVSNRTVSRWETGSNMPDLDIVMQIADFYEVDLREILDGERKSEKMDNELKETVLKVADYSNEEKMRLTKRTNRLFVVGIMMYLIFLLADLSGVLNATAYENMVDLVLGLSLGILIVGAIYTSSVFLKIRSIKKRMFKMK